MTSAKPYFIYPGYAFVAYPNRDSTPYEEWYNILETRTTIRDFQSSSVFSSTGDFGARKNFLKGATYLERGNSNDLKLTIKTTATFPNSEEKSRILSGLKLIGLFSDKKISPQGNPLDILCTTLEKKMQFEEGERDFVRL